MTSSRPQPPPGAGRRRIRSGVMVAALLAVLGLLAACGTAGAKSTPTWTPVRTPSAIALPTEIPPDGGGGSGGGSGGTSGPTPVPSGSPSSSGPTVDPNVVATNLAAPTGIAVLPDGTALVGERTTGRIVLVQAQAGRPVRAVKSITGLNTTGGGGLLDIALSATYAEDGLILALITTAADTRVVHFTLAGPVTPILTGIPRGPSDNVGRLLVLGNGEVLVGTGDAGTPAAAADPKSLAGKVLRVDDVGQPVDGNPTAGSPVYTSGHKSVNGLCVDATTSQIFATEAGSSDELNILEPGQDYGWPNGSGTSGTNLAATKGVGGCAVVGDVLYVTGLGGKDVFQTPLGSKGSIGTLTPVLNGKYGRISNVVAAEDGTLWLTTSNRDGQGKPVSTDERVLHIRPTGGGGGSTV